MIKQKSRSAQSKAMQSASLFLPNWICRQFLQVRHQMRDHAVSAKRMILVIDILHNLPIPDRIESLLDILLVSLIEPVSEQRDHRHADSFIVRGIVLQLLRLPPVLPCNDSYRQYTNLLNPVFLHCLRNHLPVQRHPFLPCYTRIHVPPLL